MNFLKRNKDKDGRKGSKSRSPEKDMSPEVEDRSSDKEDQRNGKKKGKKNGNEDGKSSVTDKMTTFMYFSSLAGYHLCLSADSLSSKPYLKDAQTWTAKEASDAKKDLQKYAGLGHRPDVVPKGEAFSNGEPRTVELGWVSMLCMSRFG